MATVGFVSIRNTLEPNLSRIRTGLRHAIERAIEREANAIMTEAKLITPVDTGALRSTGTVEPTTWFGDTGVVIMRFGGDGVDYAVPVHEILSARHELPTQAKFLEWPLQGARWGFMDRITADVQAWIDRMQA